MLGDKVKFLLTTAAIIEVANDKQKERENEEVVR